MTKKKNEVPLDRQREALLKELADLEGRLRKRRIEYDILEKASEFIKEWQPAL